MGAKRGGGGCLQDWLGNMQRPQFQVEESDQVVGPQSNREWAPPGSSNREWTSKDPDEGRGSRGCSSRWGRLPGTVFFSQELTPSGMTDTWDPKTAGLEEPQQRNYQHVPCVRL